MRPRWQRGICHVALESASPYLVCSLPALVDRYLRLLMTVLAIIEDITKPFMGCNRSVQSLVMHCPMSEALATSQSG